MTTRRRKLSSTSDRRSRMAKISKKRAAKRAPRQTGTATAPQAARFTAPVRPTTPANTYTSKPVSVAFADPQSHRYDWADLEILGIDHSESSYEGRVFFNNP